MGETARPRLPLILHPFLFVLVPLIDLYAQNLGVLSVRSLLVAALGLELLTAVVMGLVALLRGPLARGAWLLSLLWLGGLNFIPFLTLGMPGRGGGEPSCCLPWACWAWQPVSGCYSSGRWIGAFSRPSPTSLPS